MHRITGIIVVFMSMLFSLHAYALEGDWEAGGSPSAMIVPSRSIYGGGAELFGRYSVLDGLSVSMGAGFYGARQTDLKDSLGLYTLRLGLVYTLDVLEWVPGVGLHVSSIFSEDERWKWHRGGNGMGIDFDVYVLYRGVRQLGVGIFFSYHLVFTDADYMTTGLTISWNSGLF